VNCLAEAPITWQSKTQTSVALPSMESEYMAPAAAAEVQEVIWLQTLLQELRVS